MNVAEIIEREHEAKKRARESERKTWQKIKDLEKRNPDLFRELAPHFKPELNPARRKG